MKFDKETLIVIAVAGVLILGSVFYMQKVQTARLAEQDRIEKEKALQTQKAVTRPEVKAPVASEAAQPENQPESAESAPVSAPETSETTTASAPQTVIAGEKVVIKNNLLEATINTFDGTIDTIELTRFLNDDKLTNIIVGTGAPKKTFELNVFNGYKVTSLTHELVNDSKLIIRRTFTGNPALSSFILAQTYELIEDSYGIVCSMAFENPNNNAIALPELVIWTGGMPRLNSLAGDVVYNERLRVDYSLTGSGKIVAADPLVSTKKQDKYFGKKTDLPTDWVGGTNKYFASFLITVNEPFNAGTELARDFRETKKAKDYYTYPAIAGKYKKLTVAPQDKLTLDFIYYCGPKEIKGIEGLPHAETLIQALHLSYISWLNVIVRPLVWLLNYLKGFSGSYGWAIILLTIIVRAVFWPVTQKANKSMRKMQKLQPMVAKLKEDYKKYNNDPGKMQEMNMKVMEIYRKEKVNPLGGCLPILLQLPVFFALYSALDTSVELRQVAFWWITDLSKPDLIGPQINLPFFGMTGLHPLVIAMTLLMVLQQKMTPTAMTDPMQQKIMMMMPIMMLLILYNLPAGLTLYWTVSQILSILQLKYTQIIAQKEEDKQKNTSSEKPKKKTA